MTIYRKAADALGAHVGASVVVLNIDSLKYFELSEVASRIWEMLDLGPLSQEEICQTLLQEFDVPEDQCVAAVQDFLSDAEKKGLVLSE
jgi:hypothetical protein